MGGSAVKLSKAVCAEMLSAAISGGMPTPSEDHNPGVITIGRALNNVRPNGPCAFIAWECYLSMKDELAALSTGTKMKDMGLRLVARDAGITVLAEGTPDIRRINAPNDVLAIQDVLTLRSFAHAVAGIVPYAVYQRFTTKYIEKLRQTPPGGYRPPTVAELLKCDRDVHEYLMRFVAQSHSLADGLDWLSTQWETWFGFRILDCVPAAQPDRGLEPAPKARRPVT